METGRYLKRVQQVFTKTTFFLRGSLREGNASYISIYDLKDQGKGIFIMKNCREFKI